ncbi:hypothetical protein DCF75_14450 [Edwardsiella tarda]|uniref:hypothetical protein n=1 Tax=Edwardsiella tarda TaxID=636 RepID=UPI0010575A92|nr:hypothetical protein [Edwardsiella tarda]UCQ53890.1 hypothetical protein DCF75_14450 [Edwardsiella tarda]
MKFNEDFFWKVVRFIKGEPRKWLGRVMVLAALAMITDSFWAQLFSAFLVKYFGVNPETPDWWPGWVLLAISIAIIFINHNIDNQPKVVEVSIEDKSDKKTLFSLFCEIHIPSMDLFFENGRSSFIYVPAIHYAMGVESIVSSSTFYIHDSRIKALVFEFYEYFSSALSFPGYFKETNNPNLQKFNEKYRIHSDSDAREAFDKFGVAIREAERCFKSLCLAVREKYPEFDFNVTNRKAADDYTAYYSELDNQVTDFQFSIMSAIVELEACRQVPSLSRLADEISKPVVDVQVAMNKLIKLGYAHHLYKGMPYQKYTLSDQGREYYVENRSG